MKQQHFTIESYDTKDGEVIVMTEKYSIAITVTIPQDKFEWWLRLEDKLEWCIDTADHQGEHQQFFGTMSLEEYWATDERYIKEDLYKYIITHPIKKDGVVFSNSLESLLLAFDLHNAQRINPLFNTRWEHEQEIFDELIN